MGGAVAISGRWGEELVQLSRGSSINSYGAAGDKGVGLQKMRESLTPSFRGKRGSDPPTAIPSLPEILPGAEHR